MSKIDTIYSGAFSKNVIISDEEKQKLDCFILPKLKNKKEITVFCSLNFITTNYLIISTVKKLAELSKEGCKIICVLWDINTFTHSVYLKSDNSNIPQDEFMMMREKNLRDMFAAFGASPEKIFVITSSALWRRFININKSDMFFHYFKILGEINLKDIVYMYRAKHILQMPADIFFSTYISQLFPESNIKQIDVILGGNEKEMLYSQTRKLMYGNGMIKSINPILIFLEKIPRIDIDSFMPSADMKQNEITDIIFRADTLDWDTDVDYIFDNVFSLIMENVHIDGKKYTIEEAKKFTLNKSKNEKMRIVSDTFLEYYGIFNNIMKNSGESIIGNSIKNCDIESLKGIGSILKSKHMVNIIKMADGTNKLNQIAKKLNMHPANLTKYVKILEKNNMIKIDDTGRILRNFEGVNVNFNSL